VLFKGVRYMEVTYRSAGERFKPEVKEDGWALNVLRKPNMGARVRFLKPGSEMGLHSTEGWEEFLHILDGTGRVYVKRPDRGGQWISAEPGCSIYLHKNTFHRLKAGENGMAYMAVARMDGFRWHDVK
jgi:quercetin dioxygenase-like cupin family protein